MEEKPICTTPGRCGSLAVRVADLQVALRRLVAHSKSVDRVVYVVDDEDERTMTKWRVAIGLAEQEVV